MIGNVIQITLAVLLTIVVLLQNQSAGLGSAFGGGSSFHTKRGLEKSLFYVTIALAIAFSLSSLILLI